MSLDTDIIFNTYLILPAAIVDSTWYIVLTLLVTSNIAFEFIKNKSAFLQKLIGSVFIIIGVLLLIELSI